MNNIVKERVQFYKQSKENREQGIYNGIPIYKIFPRFGTLIPTFSKGDQMLIVASNGIGKSQFWIGMVLYPTYKLIKKEGIKVKFIIFLLEDTVEMLIDRLFSMVLFDKYGIKADGLTIKSLRENPIKSDTYNKIEEVSPIVEDILSYCHIEDSISNPTGMYKYCRSKGQEWGTHYFARLFNDNNSLITHEEYEKLPHGSDDDIDSAETRKKWKYSHYKPNDKDEQIVLITDNLNNLSPERGRFGEPGSERISIGKWSREYCRLQMTKHWRWNIVNIQQFGLDSESQEFTYRGDSIIERIKPSLSMLGNNKEVSRDHHLILGIFAPDRFGLTEYKVGGITYNIGRLRDNFRSLIVLKSNISECNKELPLCFYGACSTIKELPKEQSEINNELYQKIIDYKY